MVGIINRRPPELPSVPICCPLDNDTTLFRWALSDGCEMAAICLRPCSATGGHVAVGQFKQLTTRMGPAIRHLDRVIISWIKHTIISGIAIHLQDTLKSLQYLNGMFADRYIPFDHPHGL